MVSGMLERSHFVREGWFKREDIRQLLDEHRNHRYDHHVRLWMLLALELWHQLYIEGVKREALAEKLQGLCLRQ
jgi:hypothetical protein